MRAVRRAQVLSGIVALFIPVGFFASEPSFKRLSGERWTLSRVGGYRRNRRVFHDHT